MLEPPSDDRPDVSAINAKASALMKRGIRLIDEGGRDAAVEALRCFDAALELRRRLPIEVDPQRAYGLAACWLNRADALVRLWDAWLTADALHSYDEGIALLRRLPLDADPRYPRRLAIAHQNRGLALHARGGSLALAHAAFREAVAVLEQPYAATIADRDHLLAAVWTNLSNALVSDAAAEPDARAAARKAVDLIRPLEGTDRAAAEVGLKARHVLCRAVARSLSEPQAPGLPMPEHVHDATDAVDDGLMLVEQWERRGGTEFRALAADLFRFGALVYARYQPQFLREFIAEHLDPARSSDAFVDSEELQAAARDARAMLPDDSA